MINNDLHKSNIPIGICIVVASLSATYVSGSILNTFNTNNPSPTYTDSKLLSEQFLNKIENYHSIKLLDIKTKRTEITYENDDYVVEIPVAKRMRFKFGKPTVKVFEI